MSNTFSLLTTAKPGIYAVQKGLDVIGNNITNININGYTRQCLDQVSLISGGSDRYYSRYNVRAGQGALVDDVSQLRDPGLDISYRESQADVGSADSQLAGLEKLADILDEVGKGDGEQDDGLILSQLNGPRDPINKANTNGIEGYDPLIRQSTDTLCDLFSSAAKALAELKTTFEGCLEQDVDGINSILSQVQELNVAIRNSDIRGDEGLGLQDQRNLLLDTLSQHMKIDVTYSMEDVGSSLVVEELTVKPAIGGKNTLIDGEFATRVSTGDEVNEYEVKLGAPRGTNNKKQNPQDIDLVMLGDIGLYGSLQSLREILTEKGEYSTQAEVSDDKDAAVKWGIPYHQMTLDSSTNKSAEQMNALNQAQGVTGVGDLFMNRNNPGDKTTASNAVISRDWAGDRVHMLSSAGSNAPSDDRSSLARFLEVFSKEHQIDLSDIRQGTVSSPVSTSFKNQLLHTQSTLTEGQMGTTVKLNNYLAVNNTVYTDRDSVSGVDLNDEAASLMVYQKAYTVACRLMIILEEALGSLTNGMVVQGLKREQQEVLIMIRITTNSSLRMYRSNLMKSTNSLNSAMIKLMTQRQFSSYASNPAAATRAFRIHSSLNATNAQYSNNDIILHKYETAWSTLESALNGYDGLVQDTGRVPTPSGLNDTSLSTLNAQGQIIREGAEAIIQTINGKYGNNFVFAGTDSLNAPFVVNDKGFVTYRGVEIDNSDTLDDIYLDNKGQSIKDVNGKDVTNKEVLDMWNEEHQYADIGLGFRLDGNGEAIPSTAFDSAISGIGIMGYGVDADGDPKNPASIMLRLADIFEGYDHEIQTWNVGSCSEAEELLKKLGVFREAMGEKWTTLDTEANFLDKNRTQLRNAYDAFNVERSNLEDIDPADAILELVWAKTCYDVALQVGIDVIPQSLMDYMK